MSHEHNWWFVRRAENDIYWCPECSAIDRRDAVPHPGRPDALLTETERAVVAELGQIWNRLCTIVGDGRTRKADLDELIVHVHALQQAVLSQAAGRAYPQEFRLLGGVIPETVEVAS